MTISATAEDVVRCNTFVAVNNSGGDVQRLLDQEQEQIPFPGWKQRVIDVRAQDNATWTAVVKGLCFADNRMMLAVAEHNAAKTLLNIN